MLLSGQVIQQTTQRYQERSSQRATHTEKLRLGNPLDVDSPERVQKRIGRIVAPEASRAAVMPNHGALERIMGASDLMSVNYLEIGLRAARCVGRISIRTRTGQTLGYGTGFTVSPRLLITNNHVLDSADVAATSRVEFNFQEDAAGNPLQSVVLNLEPGTFFVTDEKLDFTVVAVSPRSAGGVDLGGFCWLPLIEQEGKVIIGEYLNIIQHPNGEPKQLALRENQLLDLLPDFLHYHTDTAPGSSGSPVFNDQWEVVGLHHSGVPRVNAEGQVLTRDGVVWREEMGEHRIDWIANEGVRTSRIVQALRAADLSAGQDRLRAEMFQGAPAAAAEEQQSRTGPVPDQRLSIGAPVIDSETATWTVPLTISVQLGASRRTTQLGTTDDTSPVSPVPDGRPPLAAGDDVDSADLRAAFAELARTRERTYFDQQKDETDRRAYYSTIQDNLNEREFFLQLSRLVQTTHATQLAYKPMRHVYPWVDLHPDRKLRSIYSGKSFNPEELIREDSRVESARARLAESMRVSLSASAASSERFEAALDLLEASLPFNCEHVVPQSWFDKKEPMRGDLHHLFACESGCNSFRGNIPYFDFSDFEEALRSECGKREQKGFEPSNGKGVVARATLYFLLRYPGEINAVRNEYLPERIATLLTWHNAKPPTEYERHRNAAVFEAQGNRNPLIDHPAWAVRTDFTIGLGQ
jgi:endonuclease I/V8-like Glu-specific endopeptidase